MKLHFTFALAINVFLAALVVAQEPRIDIDAITDEMQKSSKATDDAITIVMWIPTEFWQGVLQDDKTISKAQKDEITGFIRPYTLILVVDGKVGDLGKTAYRSDQAIRKTIKLIDGQGREWKPLNDNEIGAGMKSVLKVFKPILVNILGSFGSNMHILAFNGTLPNGALLLDAKREGKFTVSLELGRDFTWRLPLSSLVPKKRCSVDGELLSGSWKYCPFHGGELKP